MGLLPGNVKLNSIEFVTRRVAVIEGTPAKTLCPQFKPAHLVLVRVKYTVELCFFILISLKKHAIIDEERVIE